MSNPKRTSQEVSLTNEVSVFDRTLSSTLDKQMGTSSIEWTDRTWNAIRGCSMISPGCQHCYAMKQAHQFSGPGKAYEGLTELGPDGPRWNGKIRLVPEALDQ